MIEIIEYLPKSKMTVVIVDGKTILMTKEELAEALHNEEEQWDRLEY